MKHTLKKVVRKYATKISNAGLLDVYENNSAFPPHHEIDGYFKTSDGCLIPVTKHHRYSLKKTWTMFGPLSALHALDQKGFLTEKDQKFFQNVQGHRTIQAPLPEIREVLKPYLEKHINLFLSTEIPDLGPRVLKPKKTEVEQAIQRKIRNHENLFDKIQDYIPSFKFQDAKILEIGYTSGGESIIGFERLGMDAYGIDYNYDGSFETNSRHKSVAELAQSKATFLMGDITQETSIDSESLDMIYTLSVLKTRVPTLLPFITRLARICTEHYRQ